MKKIFKNLFGKLLISAVLLSLSVSTFAQQNDKGIARVQKNNGIYAFCDNEPISDYEIIDRTKAGLTWSGQFSEVRNKLIKKAVKDYPNADGVVISMSNSSSDKAIILKFKEGQEKDQLALARANKVQGLYVFTDCEPISDYEIVGRESVSYSLKSDYQSIRDKLIKKALKDNPDAEGVIFTFSNASSDKATVIKFK